jgi:glycosyltransferase involved in cell wall biosynthesis
VFFTGRLPLDEVSRYYKKSKTAFCLFPRNRTNRLILPIKLFEYATFGLPVIGSDFGHIAEIVRSGGIGKSVNPHKAEDVASVLIDLIAGEQYKTYIPVCIQCAKSNYLWENQKAKLLRIYEALENR